MQNRGPVYQQPHTFNLSLPRSLTAPHTSFAGCRQNRVHERPADAAGEAGGSGGDNLGCCLWRPDRLLYCLTNHFPRERLLEEIS
jgi:hypothetical protein